MPKKNAKNSKKKEEKPKKSKSSKSQEDESDGLDEFSRKLDEYIQQRMAENENSTDDSSSDDDEANNDEIDTDDFDFNEIEIVEVKCTTDYSDKPNNSFNFTTSKYFAQFDKGTLLFEVKYEGKLDESASYAHELRDSDDNIIACNTYNDNFGENKILTILDIEAPLEGNYWLYIKHNGHELHSEKIVFVKIDDLDWKKSISIENFSLYRLDELDDFNGYDYPAIYKTGSRSCFNYNNLAGILFTTVIRNISGKELPCALHVEILDDKSRVVYTDTTDDNIEEGKLLSFISQTSHEICSIGTYLIKLYFLDIPIAEYRFNVGLKDVRYQIKSHQLTPGGGIKGGIYSESHEGAHMNQLNSMIGLKRVKEQLETAIANNKLIAARNKLSLPNKPKQLHLAFLGNPGTGKTTVAKLLGQIYKEMGLLSKGNVILRDRSSLMTQNWGGEGEMVNTALEEAKGNVLFIDEAYDLVTEHKTDPGKLVISALLSAMSDEKNRDIMIIFAGYSAPMERMLSKNPGLSSRVTRIYFEDYNEQELMQIADLWLDTNFYKLTADARKYLKSIIANAYASRDEYFGNGRYINNLLENEIQPAMAKRLMEMGANQDMTIEQLTTIEASDIPNYNQISQAAENAISKLDNMVGLENLKKDIRSHLSFIKFVQARRDNHIDTPIPPLHMVFTGNPGTGKSSVAEYLGDIYRSLGILSVGNVINVTRADMIDRAVGGTEENMKNLITAAHGNILFIDEAYTLFEEDGKDFGKNAIEVLLDTLGKERTDMIVILAGYPKEMDKLLNMNPGLKGRFPNIFNFEDYSEDELFQIAKGVITRNNLTATKGATDAIKAFIRKECKQKDSNFSNARFVVRLITTQILPNMARRLEGVTDAAKLKRILQCDVPIEHKDIKMINENLFDEDLIDDTLERLDNMVGLTKVKVAIHQFVDFARTLNRKDPSLIDKYPLQWSFVGKTGTGKSSVAQILSELLKAMHLIDRGHTVELSADEIYSGSQQSAENLIQAKMVESQQGLLFVDGDAPAFGSKGIAFNPEFLRVSLASNTKDAHGRFAVVIAEQESPYIDFAKKLNRIGISNYNNIILFDNYNCEELAAILASQLKKIGLHLSDDAATIMYSYIKKLHTECSADEANARTINHLANAIFTLATTRGITSGEISAEMLADFHTLQPPKTKLGFS